MHEPPPESPAFRPFAGAAMAPWWHTALLVAILVGGSLLSARQAHRATLGGHHVARYGLTILSELVLLLLAWWGLRMRGVPIAELLQFQRGWRAWAEDLGVCRSVLDYLRSHSHSDRTAAAGGASGHAAEDGDGDCPAQRARIAAVDCAQHHGGILRGICLPRIFSAPVLFARCGRRARRARLFPAVWRESRIRRSRGNDRDHRVWRAVLHSRRWCVAACGQQ